MYVSKEVDEGQRRNAPLDMSPDTFRDLGHRLVDQIADFMTTLRERPVTPGETPTEVRAALGTGMLPAEGAVADALLDEAARLLFDHSLLDIHPRFWGYVISSAAPIGALGDLLAASVNPNVGGWGLSPMATEIEAQTVRWIAELLGYPAGSSGLLVSGGNMANFVGFLAARQAKAPWDVRGAGMAAAEGRPLRAYASTETHTWLEKAAAQYGLGTAAVRSIPADDQFRMDLVALRRQVAEDLDRGEVPFMVVGSAGTVSTGTVDPLPEMAAFCREHDLWLHVDGAYGALAAVVEGASDDLKGLREADSVAVDPHKWLYTPLEAGCILVRDPNILPQTFSFRPPYYKFEEDPNEAPINYYEYGPQNSRGFRALKVWLGLKQAGRSGYAQMIADDIDLAHTLYRLTDTHPELEAFTHSLSITTFRYVPTDLAPGSEEVEAYLNRLNDELLTRLQTGGEAFLSNAVLKGAFVLRLCIVNFRTTLADIEALPGIVARLGRAVDADLRPASLRT